MSKLSVKRKAFVNAYLGEAAGNATKAAILAGYSERSAYSQAHDLLKNPEVAAAVGKRLQSAQMTADESLTELATVARAQVSDIRASDKIAANKLILQVNGALKDKHASDSRITVNIGFLTSAPSARGVELCKAEHAPVIEVMAQPTRLAASSDDDDVISTG